MKKVMIVGATRTPIGSFRGSLSSLSAVELGAVTVRRLLENSGLSAEQVDETIFGGSDGRMRAKPRPPDGHRRRVARQHAGDHRQPRVRRGLKSGPARRPAIRCGDAEVVIAGGQESMSNAPYLLDGARAGLRFGHAGLKDSMITDGLWDAFNDYHMGITAENVAREYDISREQQDAFAARSQQKRRPPLSPAGLTPR